MATEMVCIAALALTCLGLTGGLLLAVHRLAEANAAMAKSNGAIATQRPVVVVGQRDSLGRPPEALWANTTPTDPAALAERVRRAKALDPFVDQELERLHEPETVGEREPV